MGNIKIDTTGSVGALARGEVAYSEVDGELYVGSGNGVSGNIGNTKEFKVSSKAELLTMNEANMTAYGYSKRVPKEERWLETDTPNVIVDTVADSVRFSDGLVDRLGDELVVNGDFSDGATGWSLGSGWTVSGGKAKHSGSDGDLLSVLGVGIAKSKVVKVQISVSEYISGSLSVQFSGSIFTNFNVTASGLYELNHVVDATSDPAINIRFYTSAFEGAIDNISVHELPQAQLPLAPYVPTSTDELLDYSLHNVTTQTDHSKGDVIHVGNSQELVTNGTFDTDTGWTKGAGWSISAGTANCDGTQIDYSSFSQLLNISNPIEYNVTFDIIVNAGSLLFRFGSINSSGNIKTITASGNYTFAIETVGGTDGINFLAYSNFIGSIDNISVKAIEQAYQATTDTTALDLLTDTAKFQQIDHITRQDVLLITKTGYKSVRGINLFDETINVDAIASAYGYSKLQSGLFSISGETVTNSAGVSEVFTGEAVIVGVVGRLNSGAYHPVYNSLGAAGTVGNGLDVNNTSDWRLWYYASASYIDSLFKTIKYRMLANNSNGLIGSTSGLRPDDGSADKTYKDGYGGLVYLPQYTTKPSLSDLLEEESQKLISGVDGLDCGVECFIGNSYASTSHNRFYPDGYFKILLDSLNNNYRIFGMCMESGGNAVSGTLYQYFRVDSAYYILNIAGTNVSNGGGGKHLVTKKQPAFLTQNVSTTVDVVGDPASYPAGWLAQLDKNIALPFNPLLVSDEGVDLIPDGTTSKNLKLSSKFNKLYTSVLSDDRGNTYVTDAFGDSQFSTITNSRNATDSAGRIRIYQTPTKNTPTVQSNPLKVLQVQPKALFTNSHSIYQGNGLAEVITGKIATSNALVKLESGYLSNGDFLNPKTKVDCTQGTPNYTYLNGEMYTLLNSEFVAIAVEYTLGSSAGLNGNDIHSMSITTDGYLQHSNGNKYFKIHVLPTNTPTTLTADTSSASKSFAVLEEDTNGEVLVGLYGMELVPNTASANDYTLNDTANYPQLTNGTTTDDGGNTVRTYHGTVRTGIYNK